MPKDERSKYTKAFQANKAERKAARAGKKKKKLEKQRIATELRKAGKADGPKKRKHDGDDYPGNKRRTEVALSNSTSSALPVEVKIEPLVFLHSPISK
jgi:hypothetical protein